MLRKESIRSSRRRVRFGSARALATRRSLAPLQCADLAVWEHRNIIRERLEGKFVLVGNRAAAMATAISGFRVGRTASVWRIGDGIRRPESHARIPRRLLGWHLPIERPPLPAPSLARPRLLEVAHVARRLSFCDDHVRRLLRKKKIAAVRVRGPLAGGPG